MSDLIVKGEEYSALKEQAALAIRSGFLPQTIKNDAQAVIIAVKARELGLPLMAGYSLINVINGKPALSAEGMLAVIYKRFPQAIIAFKTMTNQKCTIEAQRDKSMPKSTFEFTMDDATQAGLAGSATWKKYPRALLKARCISEMARTVFPDALIGASYTPEELGAEEEIIEETSEILVLKEEPKYSPPEPAFVPAPTALNDNVAQPLRALIKLQQTYRLEAAQISQMIKEVTGRDRAGDCTKSELDTVIQALKDKFS